MPRSAAFSDDYSLSPRRTSVARLCRRHLAAVRPSNIQKRSVSEAVDRLGTRMITGDLQKASRGTSGVTISIIASIGGTDGVRDEHCPLQRHGFDEFDKIDSMTVEAVPFERVRFNDRTFRHQHGRTVRTGTGLRRTAPYRYMLLSQPNP